MGRNFCQSLLTILHYQPTTSASILRRAWQRPSDQIAHCIQVVDLVRWRCRVLWKPKLQKENRIQILPLQTPSTLNLLLHPTTPKPQPESSIGGLNAPSANRYLPPSPLNDMHSSWPNIQTPTLEPRVATVAKLSSSAQTTPHQAPRPLVSSIHSSPVKQAPITTKQSLHTNPPLWTT